MNRGEIMGKIGTMELILILGIALVVFGPSKLPELGRTLGKTLNEFKKFSNDIKADVSVDLSLDDKPKKKEVEKESTEIEESDKEE